MKKTVSFLLALMIAASLCGCAMVELPAVGAEPDYRAAANVSSGAAKIAQVGDYIFVSRSDGIVKFDPDMFGAGKTLDDFMFKKGNYSDICFFAGKLYAIEMVADDRVELVSIDTETGEEQVVKVYQGDDANNVWFFDLVDGKLILWVNGSIYSLNDKNSIKDTGFRNVLFVTSDGAYESAAESNGQEKGLVFVPNDKKSGSVVEFANLRDKNVSVLFRYESRIYITVDNRPAYVEHGGDTSVTYIEGLPEWDDEDGIFVRFNYMDSPDKTLLIGVGRLFSEEGEYKEGEFYSEVYSFDVKSGTLTEIYRKTHVVVPICWISVAGDEVFVGGIADQTDWVMAG